MPILTKDQAGLVRAAMYEAKIDSTRGAGQRLNNAMIAADTRLIEGDAEVVAIVSSMIATFPGDPYNGPLTLVLNAISTGAPPVPPAPSEPAPPPVISPPVPPVSPLPPVSGDVAGQVRAVMTSMGAVFNAEGTLEGFKLKTLGAPEGPYFGYFGVNDGALRIFAGIREMIGGLWGNRQVDENKNLPRIMYAVERDGAISWDWSPPIFGEDANPNPFKTLLIFLGGFKRWVGPRQGLSKFPIDIGTFEAGRALRFFVRRPGSTTPDIEVPLQLDAEGVAIRVGGELRRVIVDADGILAVGNTVDENQ